MGEIVWVANDHKLLGHEALFIWIKYLSLLNLLPSSYLQTGVLSTGASGSKHK